MTKHFIITVTTLFFCATAFADHHEAATKAQPTAAAPAKPAAKSTDTNAIVRDALRADKKAFIAANLGLSEVEGKKFWPVYDNYDAELAKINEQTGELIKEFAQKYETLTDKDAIKLNTTAMQLQDKQNTLRRSYQSKFNSVISGKKVARFYQLENKIQAVVRYELAQAIPLVQ